MDAYTHSPRPDPKFPWSPISTTRSMGPKTYISQYAKPIRSSGSGSTANTQSTPTTSSYYSCLSTPPSTHTPSSTAPKVSPTVSPLPPPWKTNARSPIPELNRSPTNPTASRSLNLKVVLSPATDLSIPDPNSDHGYCISPASTLDLGPPRYLNQSLPSTTATADTINSQTSDSISSSLASQYPAPAPYADPPASNQPPEKDDFTTYLDELLLAVLIEHGEENKNHQNANQGQDQDQDQAQTRTGSANPTLIPSQAQAQDIPDPRHLTQETTPTSISGPTASSRTPTELTEPSFNLDGHDNYSRSASRSASGFCSCSGCTISPTNNRNEEEAVVAPFYRSGSSFSSGSGSGSGVDYGMDSVNSDSDSRSGSDPNSDIESSSIAHTPKTTHKPPTFKFPSYESPTSTMIAPSSDSARPLLQNSPSRRWLTSMIYGCEYAYTSEDDEDENEDEGEEYSDTRYLSSSPAFFAPLNAASKRHLSLDDEDELQSASCASDPPAPPFKKRKLEEARHSTIRFSATQPASLRRGLSLRSVDEDEDEDEVVPPIPIPEVDASSILSRRANIILSSQDESIYPPTVPTTPIPTTNPKAHIFSRNQIHAAYYLPPSPPPHNNDDDDDTSSEIRSFKVPIIAPPAFHHSTRLLGQEDAAELRLRVLLERERGIRVGDGLGVGVCARWEGRGGVVVKQEDDEIDEMDEDEDEDEDDETTEVGSPELTEKPLRLVPSFDYHYPAAHATLNLGVDDTFRREIIKWMLDVLPLPPSDSNPQHSHPFSYDLYDQLSTSPETRFHAAYMFIRYLLRAVAGEEHGVAFGSGFRRRGSISQERDSVADDEDEEEEDVPLPCIKDATKTILWDIAVGCLALSVKFHRDFLAPSCPVYALDFLSLAPHAMAYDDLETSQRDILQAFSFSIGGHTTPQPILDELWLALPTLRALLDFKDGWKDAKRETWERLLGVVSEPDILRFPVSLLTVSALISGIIISLYDHYEAEADFLLWRHQQQTFSKIHPGHCICNDNALNRDQKFVHNQKQSEARSTHMRLAVKASRGVIMDLRDLLEVDNDDLRECRMWFAALGH